MSTLLFCVSITWCMVPEPLSCQYARGLSWVGYSASINLPIGKYNTEYMGEFWHHFMDSDKPLIDTVIKTNGFYYDTNSGCGYFLLGFVINPRLKIARKVRCEIIGKAGNDVFVIYHRNCRFIQHLGWEKIEEIQFKGFDIEKWYEFFKTTIDDGWEGELVEKRNGKDFLLNGFLFWDQQYGQFIFLSKFLTSISRPPRSRGRIIPISRTSILRPPTSRSVPIRTQSGPYGGYSYGVY